jgi:hypothetical protein
VVAGWVAGGLAEVFLVTVAEENERKNRGRRSQGTESRRHKNREGATLTLNREPPHNPQERLTLNIARDTRPRLPYP